MKRRAFLATAAGTCAAAAWQSRAGDAADLVVIDTHTHFYDPTRPEGVPWPPSNDPVLYRKVLPRDYLALPVPQKVAGTIVVEASPWVEDNAWLLSLAAEKPFIVGVVGNLPIGTPEFPDLLRRFAADKLFRGIRIRPPRPKQAPEDPALIADLERLAARGLSLDLVGGLAVLAQARSLAKRIPELTIVIDHLGGVTVDGKAPPPEWRQAVEALEPHPRVFMKVSGLVEGTGRRGGKAPAVAAFYRPVLDVLWKTLGAKRLIYGSNWPVCEHFAPLATVQQIAFDYFRYKGAGALRRVFADNAKRAYGWVSRRS